MQDELMEFAAGLDPEQQRTFAGLLTRLAEDLEPDDEVRGFSLATVGDDAQLANIDLQQWMQQAQRQLQLLSNTSKMLHDTNLAIIRKIG